VPVGCTIIHTINLGKIYLDFCVKTTWIWKPFLRISISQYMWDTIVFKYVVHINPIMCIA